MKKVLLFLFYLAPICMYAEYRSSGITWITDDEIYVTTIENSILFKYDEDKTASEYSKRELKNYTANPQKKLKKSINCKVIGYANLKRTLGYDTYVISIKEKKYYLHSRYVLNNKYINEMNENLSNKYNELIEKKKRCNEKIDSLKNTYIKSYSDSLLYYQKLYNDLQTIIDSIKINSYNNWYENLTERAKNINANVLSNLNVSLGRANSVGGRDLTIVFKNQSKKTIKYFKFYALFYNRVNDPVYCEVRNKFLITGKVTGPIESMEDGDVTAECAIYNSTAYKAILDKIEIDYMDGTSTDITGLEIKLLLEKPDIDNLIYYHKKQLDECPEKIKKWSKRINDLKNDNIQMDYKYYDKEHRQNIENIYIEKENLRFIIKDIDFFEYYNFIDDTFQQEY